MLSMKHAHKPLLKLDARKRENGNCTIANIIVVCIVVFLISSHSSLFYERENNNSYPFSSSLLYGMLHVPLPSFFSVRK